MKITRDEWATLVAEVIREQPEYAAATVQAMQAGILAALDRKAGRLVDVSLGLVEALNTKPGHVRRNHASIIRAIEASTVHPSAWSAEAIAKEK